MRDPISPFSINCHSSIRWGGAVTVWFDPFRVEKTTGDGDVIFITHDHYDHFSPEDIRRVMKPDAVLVLPESCLAAAQAAAEKGTLVTLVDVDFAEYRRQNDLRSVKKNCTIPSWLNAEAERAGVNFSAVLQAALKEELHLQHR